MAKKHIILKRPPVNIINDNISALKTMELNRLNQKSGYLNNLPTISIDNKDKLIVRIKSEICESFLPFVKRAIIEMQDEIIKKAYDLEQQEYNDTFKEAKNEARNLLKQ